MDHATWWRERQPGAPSAAHLQAHCALPVVREVQLQDVVVLPVVLPRLLRGSIYGGDRDGISRFSVLQAADLLLGLAALMRALRLAEERSVLQGMVGRAVIWERSRTPFANVLGLGFFS